MKKLMLILFVLINSICHAANLEFSQVILIDGEVAFSKTVPAGKVWKIESISGTEGYFSINGKFTAFIDGNMKAGNFPFWLPSGTVISDALTLSPGCDFLSIIEYSIVP